MKRKNEKIPTIFLTNCLDKFAYMKEQTKRELISVNQSEQSSVNWWVIQKRRICHDIKDYEEKWNKSQRCTWLICLTSLIDNSDQSDRRQMSVEIQNWRKSRNSIQRENRKFCLKTNNFEQSQVTQISFEKFKKHIRSWKGNSSYVRRGNTTP